MLFSVWLMTYLLHVIMMIWEREGDLDAREEAPTLLGLFPTKRACQQYVDASPFPHNVIMVNRGQVL